MALLRVFLLGAPSVEWEGAFLNIPRRRVRALLFRLALEMQPVGREHLATLFWADVPDSDAHRDLTHLLTHLRRALPLPDMVQCTTDYVFLSPRHVWSDTSAFLELFRAPETHPPRDLLLRGLALLRGPLLDGYCLDDGAEFEEWLTVERSVWERRTAILLAAVEREQGAMSNVAASITCAHHLPCMDMDADAHRRLVEGQLSGGNQDAVRKRWEAVNEQMREWEAHTG